MKNKLMHGLLLGSLSALAGSAGAADHYLAAKAYSKNLPDGSAVAMWGYVEDTGDGGLLTHCYDAADDALRLACIAGLPNPQLSATRLIVPPTDNILNIFLSNGLPEPSSLVIAGQKNPVSIGSGPTWDDGSTGPRGPDLAKRVRSFGSEAAANGGSESYSWNALRHGSYVLHSGTHPQKQVYMGLYGAVTRDFAAGIAYDLDLDVGTTSDNVPYDREVVLFYSEIDPDLNASIADQSYGTSIHYHAKWFLVNGEPYSTACTDVSPPDGNDDASGYPCASMAQIPDIAAGQPGENILLRFLSVAGETHVPTLQGLHMTLHAEDGQQYNWQNGDTGATTPAPRSQYSAMLPPLKTKDAIINVAADGRFALYDGNGYMTNPSDTDNFDVGDPVGGMLRFLSVQTDTDGDGVPDVSDNCTLLPNGPNTYPAGDARIQRDTNGDGFGNVCDADFNNNGIVDPTDFTAIKALVGQVSPDHDLNGNGIVDPTDFGFTKANVGQPPGPSCVTLPGGCQ